MWRRSGLTWAAQTYWLLSTGSSGSPCREVILACSSSWPTEPSVTRGKLLSCSAATPGSPGQGLLIPVHAFARFFFPKQVILRLRCIFDQFMHSLGIEPWHWRCLCHDLLLLYNVLLHCNLRSLLMSFKYDCTVLFKCCANVLIWTFGGFLGYLESLHQLFYFIFTKQYTLTYSTRWWSIR